MEILKKRQLEKDINHIKVLFSIYQEFFKINNEALSRYFSDENIKAYIQNGGEVLANSKIKDKWELKNYIEKVRESTRRGERRERIKRSMEELQSKIKTLNNYFENDIDFANAKFKNSLGKVRDAVLSGRYKQFLNVYDNCEGLDHIIVKQSAKDYESYFHKILGEYIALATMAVCFKHRELLKPLKLINQKIHEAKFVEKIVKIKRLEVLEEKIYLKLKKSLLKLIQKSNYLSRLENLKVKENMKEVKDVEELLYLGRQNIVFAEIFDDFNESCNGISRSLKQGKGFKELKQELEKRFEAVIKTYEDKPTLYVANQEEFIKKIEVLNIEEQLGYRGEVEATYKTVEMNPNTKHRKSKSSPSRLGFVPKENKRQVKPPHQRTKSYYAAG